MRCLRNGLIVGGLVLLAGQTGCAPPPSSAQSPIGLSVGQEAPEVVSHDLDGKEVRLSEPARQGRRAGLLGDVVRSLPDDDSA